VAIVRTFPWQRQCRAPFAAQVSFSKWFLLDSPLRGGGYHGARHPSGGGGSVYTIGEFSKITSLTVKTLRFYHEKCLLVPAFVDERTGYRHYDVRQIDKARVITRLRELEFTLEQIAEILTCSDDEADILEYLQRQRSVLQEKLRQVRGALTSLDKLIHQEKEARMAVRNSTLNLEEKQLPPLLMAGVRMKGRYHECGKGFAKIGKSFWRSIAGPPFLLHYDSEYKDEADFEACMPLKKGKDVPGISVRELPGGQCVALLHQGPYDELSRSYAKIMEYINAMGYEIVLPTREIYLKGPGMILRGNPKKYLTEIQMIIKG
jgi:DNA-binding transcriptional MerR regulator/effector-binding domain-containing protein